MRPASAEGRERRERALTHRSDETGFALPITIFIVTLVTIMLAAIFVRVEADRRMAESSGATVDALAIAHSGLQRYFAHYDTLGARPPDGDSLRLNGSGGYADVIARFARHPADTAENHLYIVRSTGHVIQPTQGADPQAQRTVAQFAQWQTAAMDTIVAALVAANHFDTTATYGTIEVRGADQCGVGTSRIGLRVPGMGTPPQPPDVTGSPWNVKAGLSSAVVAAETQIDWDAVVNGGFAADYSMLVSPNSWASYLLTGDVTLDNVSGTGLLAITGNLTVQGATFAWRGIILVGGRIAFLATNATVEGAVVTGLNALTGPAPPVGTVGPPGTDTHLLYDSCRADSAMASLSGFAPIPNAWVDNWATY